MGGWLNVWYIHAMEYYSAIKIISRRSNNLDESPENSAEWKVNPTGLHTAQFHLYTILKCKILEMENRLEVARGGWRREVSNTRDPYHGNVLCLDCISVKILVGIWYSFARYYPWGKLGKRQTGSLCIISYNSMWIQFLQIAQNLQLSQSEKFNTNKI